MRVVRLFAALITFVGLVPAGGCGSDVAAPTTTVAVAADPKEQLLAGIRALNSATFRMVEKTTVNTVSNTTEGVGDPVRRAMRLTRVDSVAGKATTTDTIMFDTEAYIRFEQSPVPGMPAGTWLRIDVGRLASPEALGVSPEDMTGKLGLVPAIITIERTGTHEVRGTFDMSKAAGAVPGAAAVVGQEATNSPWRARFDEGNRLVSMSVNLPRGGGLPDITIESAYSGFGEPVVVERPPAGGTVPAPESLYKVLGR